MATVLQFVPSVYKPYSWILNLLPRFNKSCPQINKPYPRISPMEINKQDFYFWNLTVGLYGRWGWTIALWDTVASTVHSVLFTLLQSHWKTIGLLYCYNLHNYLVHFILAYNSLAATFNMNIFCTQFFKHAFSKYHVAQKWCSSLRPEKQDADALSHCPSDWEYTLLITKQTPYEVHFAGQQRKLERTTNAEGYQSIQCIKRICILHRAYLLYTTVSSSTQLQSSLVPALATDFKMASKHG